MRQLEILVIRHDDPFSALLRTKGFSVLNLEMIRTEAIEDLSGLDAELARIGEYDGLFFTSPVAAELFIGRLSSASNATIPKAYTLGTRAKNILQQSGIDAVHISSARTAEELIRTHGEEEFAGKHFLFVRGDTSLRAIPELLGPIARVDDVVVYRTVPNRPPAELVESVREQLKKNEIDWICFFSPSGVDSFHGLFGEGVGESVRVAAIGETTANRAVEANLNVTFISKRTAAEEFAKDFIQYISH